MPNYRVTGSFRGSFEYLMAAENADEAREVAQSAIDISDIDDFTHVEVVEE